MSSHSRLEKSIMRGSRNLDPVFYLMSDITRLDSLRPLPFQTGSHDFRRTASRLDTLLADAFNMLALMLPGISVTYQGEEMGMTDNMDITWGETVDNKGRLHKRSGADLYIETGLFMDHVSYK